MAIDSTSPVYTAPPTNMLGSRSESMDQADFLKMLVAQMTTQDPMNPLDGQDFAAQMATMSSLQELQKMSASLDQNLQTNLIVSQSFNNTMASFLVGKVVKVATDEVQVGESGSTPLQFNLADAATEVTIDIKNSDGVVVRTLTVPAQAAGDREVPWDGLNGEGRRVPAGSYKFEVSAKDADGNAVTAGTFVEGRVEEVSYEDNSVFLRVGSGHFLLSDVIAIRNADGSEGGLIPW